MGSNDSKTHVIEVKGDFACFSRPELKVERWSYPCPTPSAARGVFDAIYCHPPEFRWQITKIEILKTPTYLALRRNEVSEVASTRNIKQWMKGTKKPESLQADANNVRQQRQTMALREVKYRLHAQIIPWAGFEGKQSAFDAQFVRRASRGKCFQQPYLGCREFVAFFRLVENLSMEQKSSPPISLDQDVGFMVYDVFDLATQNSNMAAPSISLFKAIIRRGVLDVPDYASSDVLKPERRAG